MTTAANQALRLLALGGLGEIGMNMSLYGHDGRWLMVDCGIGFDQNDASADAALQGLIDTARDQRLR